MQHFDLKHPNQHLSRAAPNVKKYYQQKSALAEQEARGGVAEPRGQHEEQHQHLSIRREGPK